MRNEIVEILERHDINGFGKPGGTDKATDHSYDGFYLGAFKKFRDKKITLLEIGVYVGGSALLWHDLLPQAKIVMVDVQNWVAPNIWAQMDPSRYDFHQIDGYKRENVQKLKGLYPEGFDVIIDDGPHTFESQLFTIIHYGKLLNPGGILIVEDFQNSDNYELIRETVPTSYYKKMELIDLRKIKGRSDDLLVVLTK